MSNIKYFFIVIVIIIKESLNISEWWEDNKSIELNENNFFDYVGKDKYVIVKIYTKWCKYCKSMHNDYNLLAEEINNLRQDVIIARFESEGDERIKISSYYGIDSYPQVIMFAPNSVEIYSILHNSDRNYSNMLDWIIKLCENKGLDMKKDGNLQKRIGKKEKKEINKEEYETFEKENKREIDHISKIYLNLMQRYKKMKNRIEELNNHLKHSIGVEMSFNNNHLKVGYVSISIENIIKYMLLVVGIMFIVVFIFWVIKK